MCRPGGARPCEGDVYPPTCACFFSRPLNRMRLLRRRYRASAPSGAVLLVLATAVPIAAQTDSEGLGRGGSLTGTSDITLALGNGLVGALYAGLARRGGGGSFKEGFVRGFAGGIVHYIGKRTSVSGVPARQIAGRVVAGAGAAVVAGAADRQPIREHFFIPLGPFSVEFRRQDGRLRAVPSVDLYDLTVLARAYADDRYVVDWQQTWASGVVVVDGCCGALDGRSGVTDGSIIFVEEGIAQERLRVIDHEFVHVLQRDFINRAWFYPLERRVWSMLFNGRELPAQIRLGVGYPAIRDILGRAGVYRFGIPPLEREAEWLGGRRRQ